MCPSMATLEKHSVNLWWKWLPQRLQRYLLIFISCWSHSTIVAHYGASTRKTSTVLSSKQASAIVQLMASTIKRLFVCLFMVICIKCVASHAAIPSPWMHFMVPWQLENFPYVLYAKWTAQDVLICNYVTGKRLHFWGLTSFSTGKITL